MIEIGLYITFGVKIMTDKHKKLHTKELLPENIRFFEEPFYQLQRKMHCLITLGQLLTESGANSTQIERYLRRCATYLGLPMDSLNFHISYNTLIINVTAGEGSRTCFRHIEKHVLDLSRLDTLSRLPWEALENQYTIEQFEEKLEKLKIVKKQYPQWFVELGSCLGCASLSAIFGGGIIAIFFTMIATLTGILSLRLCQRYHVNSYFSIAIASFIAMITASFMHMMLPSQEALLFTLISCTLFMVPGLPMINAVDDLFNNHIVSGMTRFTHAFFIVGAMTFGMAMALHFMPTPDFTSISVLPEAIYPLQLIAAFLAAAGFGVLFNVPKRLLPIVALGGLLCLLVRNLLIIYFSFNAAGAVLFGAATVGVLVGKVSELFDCTQVTIGVSSVVTLIPGVLFYRFLYSVIQINHITPEVLITSLQNGVTAILIIMCLSIGVTISNMFRQHYIDLKRQKKLDALVAKRKETLELYLAEL